MTRRNPPLTIVPELVLPLASLKLLGTDDNVAVGDVAWDKTGNRMLYCLTAAASTSTWGHKELAYFHGMLSAPGDASISYLWWTYITRRAAINNINGTAIPMPYAGRMVSMTLQAGNDSGPTVVGFHRDLSTTLVASASNDPGAVDTPTRYDFASDATFTAEQSVSISIDPTADPGVTTWTLEAEYEVIA